MRLIDRVWGGDEIPDRLARAALSPFEAVFRGVVALRGELYDNSVIKSARSSIPVVSVGNLTVGGTGKTPVTAWLASRLSNMGMIPAIVLRGYGTDEILVHRRLNPEAEVVANADRSVGIAGAASIGATVAVLDDGFQHRSAKRDADIVLVSADSWNGKVRLLPAGPWREPLSSLSRASLVVITRKAADDDSVRKVSRAVHEVAPSVAQAVVALTLTDLVSVKDSAHRVDLSTLRGKRVLAVSAVGNPVAFVSQLAALGANVKHVSFTDHHAFSSADVARILTEAQRYETVVCTLKDAVKLERLWPADAHPLWYVSQAVHVESGGTAFDSLLARIQSLKLSQPT